MQVTDLHQALKVNQDTLRFLEKAIDLEKPDLVVFTGDQLKGYSLAFKGKNKKVKVKKAMELFLEPFNKKNIPFTLTFGNHDEETGIGKIEQEEMYQSFANYIQPDQEGNPGCKGIYIKDEKTLNPRFALYLLDSGTSEKKGGYEGVSQENIDWFTNIREEEEKNHGEKTPGILLIHIPLEEYYETLTVTDCKTKGRVKGYQKGYEGYYQLPNPKEGDFFKEAPCVPNENRGLFKVLKEDGKMKGVYCGHDHKNSFAKDYQGIELAYTPCSGFAGYGPGVDRGVRIFTITQKENEVTYTSQVISYRQLLGKKVSAPFKNWFGEKIPSSKEAAFDLGKKGLLWLLALGLLGALLYWFI